jgi:hypothetical protein
MIEKGLPVPPELIKPPPPTKPPRSDLHHGLIWLALGIGLTIDPRRADQNAEPLPGKASGHPCHAQRIHGALRRCSNWRTPSHAGLTKAGSMAR